MTLTKADMAKALHEEIGLNKSEAKDVVNAFFEEISVALGSGAAVKLADFGVLIPRDRARRPGRNPKTGENVTIAPRRTVTFRSSPKLRARVITQMGCGEAGGGVRGHAGPAQDQYATRVDGLEKSRIRTSE